MGDPGNNGDFPSASQMAYKLATGQAGEVVKEVGTKIYRDFTAAAQRTLNAPTAPTLPSTLQASSMFMTGRAGEVAGDLAERGLWEAGQFVSNTVEALKRTLTDPQQPALGTMEAASMFMTGRAGEVAQNIGGRALWEVGQFAKHTVESIYGTGAPAATAPAATAPAETTAKAKTPPPGAKL